MCVLDTESARGLVLSLNNRPESKSWRCCCEVIWQSGNSNVHRAGFEGKLEVAVVEPATGGYYYPTHLALLGHQDSMPLIGKEWTVQLYF